MKSSKIASTPQILSQLDKEKVNGKTKLQSTDDIDFWSLLEVTLRESNCSISSSELNNFVNMMKKVQFSYLIIDIIQCEREAIELINLEDLDSAANAALIAHQ